MVKILGIISVVLLAVSAYFAFTNKKALADQKIVLAEQKEEFGFKNLSYDELEKKSDDARLEVQQALVEKEEVASSLNEQLEVNKSLEAEFEKKTALVKTKKDSLDKSKKALSQLDDLDTLVEDLDSLNTELATLDGELLLKEAEIKSRAARGASLKIEAEQLSSTLANYSQNKSNPTLRVSISRVVSDLGFVILSGGDSAGVVKDSLLEVLRDGKILGKLQVTATEPTTAAASVVPGSFKNDDSVRVGDVVVAAN